MHTVEALKLAYTGGPLGAGGLADAHMVGAREKSDRRSDPCGRALRIDLAVVRRAVPVRSVGVMGRCPPVRGDPGDPQVDSRDGMTADSVSSRTRLSRGSRAA